MNVINDGAIYQFIGNATNGSAPTISTLPAGSFAIFDEAGTAKETAISDSTVKYRIVAANADGTKLFSPYFTTGDVVSKTRKAYTAGVEQISYIGATAVTSGNATVSGLGGTPTVGNTYIIRTNQYQSNIEQTNQGFIQDIPYMAVTGDTEASLAAGLHAQGIKILKRNVPSQMVGMERVSNGTATIITGAIVATLTKDSKVVTFNGTHGQTVGGTFFAKGASYLVAAINATDSITLDVEYQGASGNTTSSTTYATGVGSMDTPTAWGFRFTGIAQTFGKQEAKSGRYEKVRFSALPMNNALAPINPLNGSVIAYATGFSPSVTYMTSQAANEGTGTYESVAVMETFAQFQNKDYQSDAMLANYKQEAKTTGNYSLITLQIKRNNVASPVTGLATAAPFTIVLAHDASTDYLENSTVFGIS